MLTSAFMMFQSLPVLADDHMGGHDGKPKMDREIKGDTNGDGMISKDEFMAKAEERFATMDANGDGKIEREEAKAAHEKKRSKMKEKRAEMKEKMKERRAEKDESAAE